MRDKEKELVRFGVSMPQDLIEEFDAFIGRQGYDNRSEAIRDLVRKVLIQPDRIAPEEEVAGTIVIVYDHHFTSLPNYLMDLQHHYHHEIISTMHVHLNHNQCLEIVVVKGKYGRLRQFGDLVRVQKGVLFTELSVSHAESKFPPHTHDNGSDHGHTHPDYEHHSHVRHDHGHDHEHVIKRIAPMKKSGRASNQNSK